MELGVVNSNTSDTDRSLNEAATDKIIGQLDELHDALQRLNPVLIVCIHFALLPLHFLSCGNFGRRGKKWVVLGGE